MGFGFHQEAQLGQRGFAPARDDDAAAGDGEEDGEMLHDPDPAMFWVGI
jgi:hypothetical protein